MRTPIFSFNTSRQPYTTDYGYLTCSDQRYDPALEQFLTEQGIRLADPIIIPGGALVLARPEHPRDQEFVLGKMKVLKEAHGISRWLLMEHNHCAGAGHIEDLAFYEATLLEASAVTTRHIPGLVVLPILKDFSAFYKVEPD